MSIPTIGFLARAFTFSIQVKNSFNRDADADAAPTYAIYENETSTAIATGSMTKLGSLTGFYTESLTLTEATGFEQWKNYHIRISANVDGYAFTASGTFVCLGESAAASVSPETNPVSLAEMKLHLRIETSVTADDDLITSLITAATRWAEDFQGRKFVTQTVVEKYDRFPGTAGTIYLPYPPLISITSIVYVDTAGDNQTIDSALYTVDATNEPGRVVPAYSKIWPTTRGHINDVTITYSAGYGNASAVPDTVKAAIKLMVGHWYENREEVIVGGIPATIPFGARELLWPQRFSGI
jgi:uncharacterized phiE125 gp8 family phage protein